MFEHRTELMQELVNTNHDFKALFDRHEDLDRRVDEDAAGLVRLDDLELHRLKKERLLSKDKMARMMDEATVGKAVV